MWRKKDEKNMCPVKKKILFLAANPKDTDRLRFGEEVREIKEGLRLSKYRDQFEINSEFAVRPKDLRRALLNYEPHIVHFIGHGNKKWIAVENEIGFAEFISAKKLFELFKLCSDHVGCVILSACYSDFHANAISKHIDYVIGMRREIEDKAAIEFAVGFYDALGAGKSVEEAFEFGCNSVLHLPQELIPVLEKKKGLEERDIIEKPPKPHPPPSPELVIYLLFISVGLTIEILYSFFKINLSQSFIMLCRTFYITYIPASTLLIIKKFFLKRKKSGEDGQAIKQKPPTSRTHTAILPGRIKIRWDSEKGKRILLSVFIAFALFVSFVIVDFNKPITIYWNQFFGNVDYLEVAGKKGSPGINSNPKGNKVILTSKKWKTSVFWIIFRNYSINWDEYDKIYLNVDYSGKTDFDQSAMLKLRLNNTTLSPINGKVKQVGTKEDIFLIQSRGSFYYHLKSSDLDLDNEITITLNKGKWLNFCIELALIKQ